MASSPGRYCLSSYYFYSNYNTNLTPQIFPHPQVPRDVHGSQPPSTWVQRWSHLVKPAGDVLDVACGYGRHARWFHARGHAVTVVDQSAEAVAAIDLPADTCRRVVADIENGPWPFDNRQFDAVVVIHYLWRPLLETLVNSLAPGGVFIYETFTQGNETVGKPSRPDFLLATGELLTVCSSLRIVAFEDGFEAGSGAADGSAHSTAPRFVQRIVAARSQDLGELTRYPLA